MDNVYAGSIKGTSSHIIAIGCVFSIASGITLFVMPEMLQSPEGSSRFSPGMIQSSSPSTHSNSGLLQVSVFPKGAVVAELEEFWSDYAETFDRAIDQYNAGDVIKIPANIKSEDEFFNWLKSV
jgi:hypothetical protein